MKKILAIVLATMLLLAAAGCGANNDASGDAAKKVLRVGMECCYAPFNWAQENDANGAVPIAGSTDYAYGYDVMFAKLIAERYGYELQIVKLDWEALIPAVLSGDIDCIIAGQCMTAERAAQVDFSTPYYYADIVAVTRTDTPYANAANVADLAGATCTSQLGTVWFENILPQISDANILPAQESASSMLVALESGVVDLVTTDLPTAMAAVAVYSDMVILNFSGTDGNFEVSEEDINMGISVKPGNTELLAAINAVLAELTTDDYDAMMAEAIAVQPLGA